MKYFKDIKSFTNCKHVFCGIAFHYNHLNFCFVCDGEIVEKTQIPPNYQIIKMTLKKYSLAREVSIVYEAGFSGYWLYRKVGS